MNQWIKHAIEGELITDIGQLTHDDIKSLNNAVKIGMLDKGKGGSFPKIKTVYALKGFDFIAHRKKAIEYMLYLAQLDKQ